MQELSRTLIDCHLAGFTHWDGVEVFGELEVGTPLTLAAEPDNPFDPHAVAVLYKTHKIGYLPSKHSALIAIFLQLGHAGLFEAFVNRVSKDKHPEGQIGIVIKIKDAR